jgi:hypothetical protein
MHRKCSGVRKKPMKQPSNKKENMLTGKDINNDQEITKANFMAVETCRCPF